MKLKVLDCTDCKSLDEVDQRIDDQIEDAAWAHDYMPEKLLVTKYVKFQLDARMRSLHPNGQISILDKADAFRGVPVEVVA